MGSVLKRLPGRRAVIAAVPCLLLLTGCGVADTEFHPGVAVVVGDRTITTDRVDDLTSGFCSAIEDQVTAQGQALPMQLFERGIVGQLAMQSAAEQLAQEFDVQPGSDYYSAVAEIETQAEGLSETGRDDYIEIQATLPYITDVLTQVGALQLAKEGEEEPTVDFQQARGLDELEAWVDREGVTFDPRYRTELVEGQPQPVDTDVSFAFGDLAKAGVSDGDPDPSYVASLPRSATCG